MHSNCKSYSVFCSTLLIHSIVFGYRIEDTNISQGQLGFALLTHSQIHSSKLILYKTKDQLLSTLLLKESVKLYWKSPYLQFHDDLNSFWSLHFSKEKDFNDFLDHLNGKCQIDRSDDSGNSNESKDVEITKDEHSTQKPDVAHDINDTELNENTDESDAAKKSDVVNRVAKIGHRIPMLNLAANAKNENEFKVQKNEPLSPTFNSSQLNRIPTQDLVSNAGSSMSTVSPVVVSTTFDLNSFATEYRMQSTEVRFNISKLDSKIDRVLDNIDRLQLGQANSSKGNHDQEEEIIKLEEKILDLKKENRSLKLKLAEMENVKVDEQSYKEKINDLTVSLQKSNEEKNSTISELAKEIEILKIKSEKELEELKAVNGKQIEDLRNDLEISNAKEAAADSKCIEKVRAILNQFYAKLYENVNGKDAMSAADILKLSADIIRKETKNTLNTS